jgi:cytochrome c-type biogenesis protein CcmH
VALADFFSILLDVMARFDRDGQAGPAQPGDIEGRYAV